MDPFDPDDAAQHHLLGDSWMWALRFNNGITSLGWVSQNSERTPTLRPSAIPDARSDDSGS